MIDWWLASLGPGFGLREVTNGGIHTDTHPGRCGGLTVGSAEWVSECVWERHTHTHTHTHTEWLIVPSEQRVTVGEKVPGTSCKPRIQGQWRCVFVSVCLCVCVCVCVFAHEHIDTNSPTLMMHSLFLVTPTPRLFVHSISANNHVIL